MIEGYSERQNRPLIRGLLAATSLFLATTFAYRLLDNKDTNSLKISSETTTELDISTTTSSTILDLSGIVFEELPIITSTTIEEHETIQPTGIPVNSSVIHQTLETVHASVSTHETVEDTTEHTIHVPSQETALSIPHAPQIEHNIPTETHPVDSHQSVLVDTSVVTVHTVHAQQPLVTTAPIATEVTHMDHATPETTLLVIPVATILETTTTIPVLVEQTVETVPASIAPPTILIPIPES